MQLHGGRICTFLTYIGYSRPLILVCVVQDEGYDLLATEVPEGEAAEGEQPNGYDGLNGEGAQEGDLVNGEAPQQEEQPAGTSTAGGGGLRGERQPNKVRVTTPYLTKYERARVLGTRALQIRCVFQNLHLESFEVAF